MSPSRGIRARDPSKGREERKRKWRRDGKEWDGTMRVIPKNGEEEKGEWNKGEMRRKEYDMYDWIGGRVGLNRDVSQPSR